MVGKIMPPPKISKIFADTEKMADWVANKQVWKVNWDKELVKILLNGLTTNYNRYGYYLCPCRDTEGSREKDRDLICPCQYSHADIKEFGQCYCGLYLDPKFHASHKASGSIPERRPANL
jgi:ferredoxin-thioredoxin reductase catalytic chain